MNKVITQSFLSVLFSRTSFCKFGKCIFNQSCKLTFIVRRIQVTLDVTLYHWVSGSPVFRRTSLSSVFSTLLWQYTHCPAGHTSHYCDGTPPPSWLHITVLWWYNHCPAGYITHYCDGIPTIHLAAYHTIDDTTTVQLAGNHIKMVYPLTSQLYIRILSLSLVKRQAQANSDDDV
jgi:hypothetical protein